MERRTNIFVVKVKMKDSRYIKFSLACPREMYQIQFSSQFALQIFADADNTLTTRYADGTVLLLSSSESNNASISTKFGFAWMKGMPKRKMKNSR